jgi:hypothetical protein
MDNGKNFNLSRKTATGAYSVLAGHVPTGLRATLSDFTTHEILTFQQRPNGPMLRADLD